LLAEDFVRAHILCIHVGEGGEILLNAVEQFPLEVQWREGRR
jgi:hypothetical protein